MCHFFVAGAAFGEVHVSTFSWQAQHLVKFHVSLFVAGAAFGEVHVSTFRGRRSIWWSSCVTFSWQAQHLVKFMCHFSWQAQHVVKFGMIAGAGNVVIFNRICSWRVRKVASVARRVCGLRFSGSDHARIVVGSWSDRSRIGNATSAVFS